MLKYTQAYTMFKEMIADGRLRRGERMPSIRRAAELYRISRTTVQNAYFQLAAEGYIYAKPQSGYFVAGGSKGTGDSHAPPAGADTASAGSYRQQRRSVQL